MDRSIGVLLTLGSALLCTRAPAQTVAVTSGGARWIAVGDSAGDQLSIDRPLGDINADGVRELAAYKLNQYGPAESFIMDGATGVVLNPPGAQYYGIGDAGDANADGFDDLWMYDYLSPSTGFIHVLAGPSLTTVLHSYPLERSSIVGVGDLNADGCDDHAVRFQPSLGAGVPSLTVYSGCTGAVLYQWAAPFAGGQVPIVQPAGDLNGDGYADLLVDGAPFFGRDGSIPAGVAPSVSGSPVGDVDSDGIRDFLDATTVFSGATGAVIWSFGTSYIAVFAAGDIDADGHEDLWGIERASTQQWVGDPCVSSPLVNVLTTGFALISGQSGLPILTVYPTNLIGTLPGANYVRDSSMNLGALSDGRSGAPAAYLYSHDTDISLCGASGPSGARVGMVAVVDLVIPGARPTWGNRGPSCSGSNSAYPHVSLQGRPALTETIAWRLWGALPGASCALQLGTPSAIDLSALLGPGCKLLVGPYFSGPATVDTSGFATSSPVTIPLDPGLVGFPLSAQWFVIDGIANPLGLSASDGLDFVVGT